MIQWHTTPISRGSPGPGVLLLLLLLLILLLLLLNPLPLQVEASEHGVYFERPKASRRPRYSDRWQNSGGKKGSCDIATGEDLRQIEQAYL